MTAYIDLLIAKVEGVGWLYGLFGERVRCSRGWVF